ncbi:unnamed protein product [Rotaria sp. Silwood1]|nr:unnamed protein product [Rotaria sp. Silwood1]CAF1181642.1 unnamed protein product [Rotaria sp. Silwood1]CAF3457111.1 unnamed protein product [Rotaria sp. Silwood1]CAF4704771.1 unnamed protein product [Rotaria sp. Silwood1]CAF4785026.1 unnamed protein product [Rotaria sp. Silwood1]
MTKDRLPELKANAKKYTTGENISIINNLAVNNMEKSFMIDFFDEVDDLGNIIDHIADLIDHIEYLHNVMLISPYDSEIKDELEDTMTEVRQLSDEVRKHLIKVKQMHEIETNIQQNNVRQRIIEAQLNYITKRFCKLMNKYYGSVITYREICRTRVVSSQCQIAEIKKNDNEIEELPLNGESIVYPQVTIDIQQSKQVLNDMKKRCSDIMLFKDSIQELHDMFVCLANVIELEGMKVNSIQDNLSKVAVHTIKTKNIILDAKIINHSAKKVSKQNLDCFSYAKKSFFKVI